MTSTPHVSLAAFNRQGIITRGEQQALARLTTLAKADNASADMLLALALALRTQRVGDVCVDLAKTVDVELSTPQPWVTSWVNELIQSPLVATPTDTAARPFVLDDTRLYLRRAWEQEQALVAYIQQQATRALTVDQTWLNHTLTDLYGQPSQTTVNRQRLATAISMLRGLVVIAGGPGSGKTYTVTQIINVLHAWQHANNTEPLDVVLTAPTGRAAARLTATLHDAGITITRPAMTLHRLLGRRLTATARVTDMHAEPLRADVVIVDEASMVGLPLFASLIGALKPSARLILLGDSNQLGAIDTGAVFHELCGPVSTDDTFEFSVDAASQYAHVTGEPVSGTAGNITTGIRDVIVRLNVTHRFDATGGVGQAAQLLRDTSRESSAIVTDLRTLTRSERGFALVDGTDATTGFDAVKGSLIEQAVNAYNNATNAAIVDHDPRTALRLFDQFRLLCAIHDGPYGTRSFNQIILTELARINPRFRATDRFSSGRFVLVTRNDASAGVQNGDVGVVVGATETDQVHVAFAYGSDELKMVSPYRLLEPDDPYAMSVHKAQGSQFERVALLLPDTPTPVVTRALVYTAVTRAVTAATIVDPAGGLAAVLDRMDVRVSGLSHRLFGT
ncbi:MAG: exodeoxyribonuclease V subunit alpha [Nitriliruptoraceae bacterium]